MFAYVHNAKLVVRGRYSKPIIIIQENMKNLKSLLSFFMFRGENDDSDTLQI